MLQLERAQRKNGHSLFVDEKRIFVVPMFRAAILHDSQPARGNLSFYSMVEGYHAVRDIFFEAVACKGALTLFGRDDGREVAILQPSEEPAELRTENCRIRE